MPLCHKRLVSRSLWQTFVSLKALRTKDLLAASPLEAELTLTSTDQRVPGGASSNTTLTSAKGYHILLTMSQRINDTVGSLTEAMAKTTLCRIPSHVPPHPAGSKEAKEMSAHASSSEAGVQPIPDDANDADDVESDPGEQDRVDQETSDTEERDSPTQDGITDCQITINDGEGPLPSLYICTYIAKGPGKKDEVGLGFFKNGSSSINPSQEAFENYVGDLVRQPDFSYPSDEDERGDDVGEGEASATAKAIISRTLANGRRDFCKAREKQSSEAAERNLAWRVDGVLGDYTFIGHNINLVRRLPDGTSEPWTDAELNEEDRLAVTYLREPSRVSRRSGIGR